MCHGSLFAPGAARADALPEFPNRRPPPPPPPQLLALALRIFRGAVAQPQGHFVGRFSGPAGAGPIVDIAVAGVTVSCCRRARPSRASAVLGRLQHAAVVTGLLRADRKALRGLKADQHRPPSAEAAQQHAQANVGAGFVRTHAAASGSVRSSSGRSSQARSDPRRRPVRSLVP